MRREKDFYLFTFFAFWKIANLFFFSICLVIGLWDKREKIFIARRKIEIEKSNK